MPNQTTKKQDDEDSIYLFKNFETLLQGKSNMDWSVTTDFKVFSKYLIKDIQEMQERLKTTDDDYLYNTCRHLYNIQDWIKLIVDDAGFPTFRSAWEHLFEERFGDKHLLQNMYNDCFEKWVSQKNGQYKIGENFYNILKGKLYYRNRFGQWFEVERSTAFDLKPNQELFKNNKLIEQLDNEYKKTWYDLMIRQWEDNKYQGVLHDDFLQFNDNETSPEEYAEFSIAQIKTLLKNPVSITELERWNGGKITDLEHIIKIANFVLNIAAKRQRDDSHTIYLLRDCLMFYEMHKTIDILNSKNTSADQILVGRKLLSHKPDEWGYYAVMLDVLYTAHLRYPTKFEEFYHEYARLLDMFYSLNPGFAEVTKNLAEYIKEHLRTDKNNIVIFDIGFQGSVALLTKYIIDNHIRPTGPNGKIKTDIKVGVGAQWSKKLFGHRYEGDYFPMLNRVQLMARSDELYHYKDGSLKSGKLRVVMGDKEYQHRAAIELVVLVMVAHLAQNDR